MLPYTETTEQPVNFCGHDWTDENGIEWQLTGQLVFDVTRESHGTFIQFDLENSTISYIERWDEEGERIVVKAGVDEDGNVHNDMVNDHIEPAKQDEILRDFGGTRWAEETAEQNSR